MIYRAKFTKTGYIRLVGHLDTVRIFQRAIHRTGYKLKYSEGFSPTPVLSIPNPLPLGVQSICEFIEFETEEDYPIEGMGQAISANLPEGLEIENLWTSKAYQSLTMEIKYASYRIVLPGLENLEEIEKACKKIMESKDYIYKRRVHNKRLKREVDMPLNIRMMLHELEVQKLDGDTHILYTCSQDAGATLRADVLIGALSLELGKDIDYADLEVTRLSQLGLAFKEIDS